MGLKFKSDILSDLKMSGYSTARLRKDKLLGESTIQKLRDHKGVAWSSLETICALLNCQPGDILEYEQD